MCKILVIEDEKDLRQNLCEIFSNEGFVVDSAENGSAGLEKVFEFFPDIILSDIMMPEMDGFELLNELQKNPRQPQYH